MVRTSNNAGRRRSRPRARAATGAHPLPLQQTNQLSPADCAAIRRLAEDVPACGMRTAPRLERKEIVRLLLERVEISVQGTSENAEVTCVWSGDGARAMLWFAQSGAPTNCRAMAN